MWCVKKTSNTEPEQAQPKLTAELRRESRLARIDKALAPGVTDIAEAEGIGRALASREANSPECRQMIAEFVSNEHDEMRATFYRALRVIEHAFSARREYITKDGQIVYGGQDHYARLIRYQLNLNPKSKKMFEELVEYVQTYSPEPNTRQAKSSKGSSGSFTARLMN